MDRLQDLRQRFYWTKDKLDGWRVLNSPVGSLRGDCDDFAATVANTMTGGSKIKFWWMVITLQATFWMVLSPNRRLHVVLWYRGYGWICCIFPQWSPVSRHRRLYPIPFPLVAFKLLMGKLTDRLGGNLL